MANQPMAKLGFLGLGLMGYPMARNLLRAGHSVALWSNTASKATQLEAEAGGVACKTPAEVASQADVVFLCVGDTAMVEQILLGKNGVIENARKGMTVVDASTISPWPASGSARRSPRWESISSAHLVPDPRRARSMELSLL